MNHVEEKKYNGIIIFGEMGTGKDALADSLLLLNKNCCKYNISSVIRQFFSIIKVNPEFRGKNRFLGQILADKLREVHPNILNDYCLSLIYEKWEKFFQWNNDSILEADFHNVLVQQLSLIKEKELPIIVGGRTFDDFHYWSAKNFLTVGIVCDPDIKYARLCGRDGVTVAQNSNSKHNTETQVAEIVKNKCDILIHNNKDLNHLKTEAEQLFKLI